MMEGHNLLTIIIIIFSHSQQVPYAQYIKRVDTLIMSQAARKVTVAAASATIVCIVKFFKLLAEGSRK